MATKKTPICNSSETDEIPVPVFTAANRDPELWVLLRSLLNDPTAALAVADLLEDRGDPRLGIVRELATAQCVVPTCMPERYKYDTMWTGAWFSIHRYRSCVSGVQHQSIDEHLLSGRGFRGTKAWVFIKIKSPTDAQLRAAFHKCRRDLVYYVLGTAWYEVERNKT
jgi:hypothetical protein